MALKNLGRYQETLGKVSNFDAGENLDKLLE